MLSFDVLTLPDPAVWLQCLVSGVEVTFVMIFSALFPSHFEMRSSNSAEKTTSRCRIYLRVDALRAIMYT